MFAISKFVYDNFKANNNELISSFEIFSSDNLIEDESIRISQHEVAEIEKECIRRMMAQYNIDNKYLDLVSTIYYDFIEVTSNWNSKYFDWNNSDYDYYVIDTTYAVSYGKFSNKESIIVDMNSRPTRKLYILDVKTGRYINTVIKDIDLVTI